MASASASIPIEAHAFCTEAQAQAAILRGAEASQAAADVIVRGINWGASEMEDITGRRLRSRAYTAAQVGLGCDSRAAALVPLDATATAALQAALVGEPVASANLPSGIVVARAWNGTNVGLSSAGLGSLVGSATDSITLGSGAMRLVGERKSDLLLDEWPLNELRAIYSVDAAGARTAIEWRGSALVNYDQALIEMSFNSFGFSDDFISGRFEVECRCGYIQPSGAVVGHPAAWRKLEAINLAMAGLYYQRHWTPGGIFDSTQMGEESGSFSSRAIPEWIEAALDPYMRRMR